MPRRSFALAALLLAGMLLANLEESFVHHDDGCAVETHCNACLLQLGSAGVVTTGFSLPPVVALREDVVVPATPSPEETAPRGLLSRGPPLG